MKKEINKPAAITLISLIAVIVLAAGWIMINREPERPTNAPPPGGARGGGGMKRSFVMP